jgi:hypothetical protein
MLNLPGIAKRSLPIWEMIVEARDSSGGFEKRGPRVAAEDSHRISMLARPFQNRAI